MDVGLIAGALGVIDPRFSGGTHSVRCQNTDEIVAEILLPHDLARVALRISLPVDEAVTVGPAFMQSIRPGHIPSAVTGS
jgi:hypothetical protein